MSETFLPYRTALCWGCAWDHGELTLAMLVSFAGLPGTGKTTIARTENPAHLAYHERNIAAGRRRGEIKMRFEYRGHVGPWMAWYHPEPFELEELATSSGWDVDELNILDTGFFWAVLKQTAGLSALPPFVESAANGRFEPKLLIFGNAANVGFPVEALSAVRQHTTERCSDNVPT